MYKASSGSIEYMNIFKVSNINTTLKFLREKNFWIYGFDTHAKKIFQRLNGKEIISFYLDQKVLD